MQATNRPRAPLAELPLHQFVTQSLACSPKSSPDKLLKTPSRSRSRSPSLPRSRRSSVSVSPHKQAVLQNHRLVREGSAASPSSSAQPSASSEQADNMLSVEMSVLPRRLFGDRPSKHTGSDLSLEASPILPVSISAGSRFSPHNIKNLTHHSTSRPSTPKGASTTPLNARQHRPPHTSGPKPSQYVEPSPSTQRMSEPRGGASRRLDPTDVPTTPSRNRKGSHNALPTDPANVADANKIAYGRATPLEEEPSRSTPNVMLQSLPKKKHRVSPTEIAIAHEEAGAGPLASPSPRKMADYFSPGENEAPAFGSAPTHLRSDSVSDRQQSLAALRSLTDLTSKQPVDSLTLTKSGLFLGVVARPLPGWTVFEDPIPSSDTAPSQDHAASSPLAASPTISPFSSPIKPSVPSTPNKENRIPDATFLATKVVPVALPDRAYSVDIVPTTTKTRSSSRISSSSAAPSPATTTATASRKRGTGGRLSLLADAEDDDAQKDQLCGDETIATVHGSGKKAKSRAASTTTSPVRGLRQASSSSNHQRKASAGSSRGSRKVSAVVDAAAMDAVASRTRSRTRV
ncbi:uncharacterized protein UTRI_10060 [Ustilago trichophora]|uniref:Uncharacterized protein n=1 Tax=Ustilago trichophora TaxID=86804 RepID=A0A5C3DTI8_9BASI|nr:uncharacterized protein UTRI_10060 [Ustilago trichophora]